MRMWRDTKLFAICLLLAAVSVALFTQNADASAEHCHLSQPDLFNGAPLKASLRPCGASSDTPALYAKGLSGTHTGYEGASGAERPLAYFHSRAGYDLVSIHSGGRARKDKKKNPLPFAGALRSAPPELLAVSAVAAIRGPVAEPLRTAKSIPGKRPDDPRASPGR